LDLACDSFIAAVRHDISWHKMWAVVPGVFFRLKSFFFGAPGPVFSMESFSFLFSSLLAGIVLAGSSFFLDFGLLFSALYFQ